MGVASDNHCRAEKSVDAPAESALFGYPQLDMFQVAIRSDCRPPYTAVSAGGRADLPSLMPPKGVSQGHRGSGPGPRVRACVRLNGSVQL
jgi:hypothetical protein